MALAPTAARKKARAFDVATRRTPGNSTGRQGFLPGQTDWFEAGNYAGPGVGHFSPKLHANVAQVIDAAAQLPGEHRPSMPLAVAPWPVRTDSLTPLGLARRTNPKHPMSYGLLRIKPAGGPGVVLTAHGYVPITEEGIDTPALVPKGEGFGRGRQEPAYPPATLAVAAWLDGRKRSRLTRSGFQPPKPATRFGGLTFHTVDEPAPLVKDTVGQVVAAVGVDEPITFGNAPALLQVPGFLGTTTWDVALLPARRVVQQAIEKPPAKLGSAYRQSVAMGEVRDTRIEALHQDRLKATTIESEDVLGALAPGGCSTMTCRPKPRGVTGGIANPRTPSGTGSPLVAIKPATVLPAGAAPAQVATLADLMDRFAKWLRRLQTGA